jgi:hypothetical protein
MDRLDGDFPAQPRVAGAIHLAHSAGTERAEDLVRAKPRSSCTPTMR